MGDAPDGSAAGVHERLQGLIERLSRPAGRELAVRHRNPGEWTRHRPAVELGERRGLECEPSHIQ